MLLPLDCELFKEDEVNFENVKFELRISILLVEYDLACVFLVIINLPM